MTGPVILGRAFRTALPRCTQTYYPVSGLPLSSVSFVRAQRAYASLAAF